MRRENRKGVFMNTEALDTPLPNGKPKKLDVEKLRKLAKSIRADFEPDTLDEILNSEMYEVWGLNANEPKQYEKCLNRLKKQLQQYVDSERLKSRLDEVEYMHDMRFMIEDEDCDWFHKRIKELNTGGNKGENT